MKKRIEKLKSNLKCNEAYLITSELHNYYLSGFESTDGALIITKKDAYLLVDSRYIEAAQLDVKHMNVVCFSRLTESIVSILKEDSADTVYLEKENLSVKMCNAISSKLEEAGIKALADDELDDALLALRLCKDENEKTMLQKAQSISEMAMNNTLNKLHEGMTEREFAVELEYEMKKLGAKEVSFDLITISAEKTSMPHGVPGDVPIKNNSLFTMDIGAVYNGYHSDMTRTVAIGDITDRMKRIYDLVLKAQLAALDIVKPGVKCSEVDKAARDVIENAGYGDNFKHSTGHGVGLQIHEKPAVAPSGDIVLKPGMVITVEPGVYLPGQFGVRIEDMIIVTEDGYYNFAKEPKELKRFDLKQ